MSLLTPSHLVKCIYRNNSLVLYYDNPMLKRGDHSYLIPENYALVKNSNLDKMYMLNETNTKAMEIHSDRCVKFLVSNSNIEALKKDTLLNSGFIYTSYIRYIQCIDGTINDFCNPFKLNEAAKDIDISFGTITIINSSSILYTYHGHNSFASSIVPNDFYIITNNKIISPISVTITNDLDTQLLLSFPPNSIKSLTAMELKTISTPITSDIFGYRISGDKTVSFGNISTIILMPGEMIPHSTSALNYNYIIYISKEVTNRSYGYDDINLIVNGWIEFRRMDNSHLSHEDVFSLKNIETLSSIYLNLLPCTIYLDNIIVADNLFLGP